jgi:hypothetical protein
MRCAATVLAVLALGACGPGGDERLTQREFIRRADAACERAQRAARELDELPSESDEDFADVSRRLHEIERDEVADLRRLEPPAELEAEVDEWLELKEARIGLSERLTDALQKGENEEELERVLRALRANDRRSNQIGREIGFHTCAGPPGDIA